MTVLRYPFKAAPVPKKEITTEDALTILNTKYVYSYRLKESSSDWGPEVPYVQGTHLTIENNTGQTLFFTIEFITRTFVFDVEQPPELRRQQTFTVASTTTLAIEGISPSPSGPVVTDDTFTVAVQIGYVSGPATEVSVVGTYALTEGITTVLSGPLTFSKVSDTLWISSGVTLPGHYSSNPLTLFPRDLSVDVQATPLYGPEVSGSDSFPGYWVAALVTMTFGSITVDPVGPVTSGTFSVSVPVDFNTGPSVPVTITGTYALKEGTSTIISGALSFSQISPTLWQSSGLVLPEYTAAVPTARDLVINVTATPGVPHVSPIVGSLTVPGYWVATVVPGAAANTGFRNLMSNYQDFWMNMDRLPGVRHSFTPFGGDVSADDLYIVSVLPVKEQAPYFFIYEENCGTSPPGLANGGTWDYEETAWHTFTSPAGTITGLRVRFTVTHASSYSTVVITHPTAGEIELGFSSTDIGQSFDISSDYYFPGEEAAGLWSVSIRDYDSTGNAAVKDLIITIKG